MALGLALRRLTQKQVVLVDLGLQSASLAAILDLKSIHSIGELADPTTSVDSIRLESATSKHASGLYLLSAPARIEDGEMVSPGTIETTIGVMLQLFDYVLIDCGHHVNEGSVAAWERAGNVLYVLEQSITAVRATQRFLDLFERLKLKQVSLDLLLNHYRPRIPCRWKKFKPRCVGLWPFAFRTTTRRRPPPKRKVTGFPRCRRGRRCYSRSSGWRKP